jgi:hypothetical protein
MSSSSIGISSGVRGCSLYNGGKKIEKFRISGWRDEKQERNIKYYILFVTEIGRYIDRPNWRFTVSGLY